MTPGDTNDSLSSILNTLLTQSVHESQESVGSQGSQGSQSPPPHHHHSSFLGSWEFIICVVIVATVIVSFMISLFCIAADKLVKYLQRRRTRSEIIAHFQKYWKVEVCRNCWCRPATVRCDCCRQKYFCSSCSDAVHNYLRDKRFCSAWRTSLSKHVIVSIRKHTPNDHEGSGGMNNQSVPGTPRWGHKRGMSKTIAFHAREPSEDAAGAIDAMNIGGPSSFGNTGTDPAMSSPSTSPFSSSPLSGFSTAVAAASFTGSKGYMGTDGVFAGSINTRPGDGGYAGNFGTSSGSNGNGNGNNNDVAISVNDGSPIDNAGNGMLDYVSDGDDEDGSDDDDILNININRDDTTPLLRALGTSANSYTTFRTLIEDADGYDSS